MNEQTINTEQPEESSDKKGLKVFAVILLLLLAIIGTGYSIYEWRQNEVNNLQSQLSDRNTQISSLQSQISNLKSMHKDSKLIPEKLPNGQTVTYPDTKANRNILFWSTGESGSPSTVMISHKLYTQFTSQQDNDLLVKVCGTPTNLKALQGDLIYGILNTSTKTVTLPQNGNCLDAFASSMNSDKPSLEEAQKAKKQIKSDIDGFLKTATFK